MSSDDDEDSHGDDEGGLWSPQPMKHMVWAGLFILLFPIIGVILEWYLFM